MATRVRSYSKINLGLAIGPARPDGFHGLTTLYQTLEAHDLVTVLAESIGLGVEDRITITSNDRRVPVDERNTVWKMLERALLAKDQQDARQTFRGSVHPRSGWAVSVHIEKRLPMRGGLGAGSANAAAALLGFEREAGFALSGEERLRLAAEVGSDVPLFLLGGAVLGLGRGEQVVPVPDLVPDGSGVEVVLALPNVGVSTPQAFQGWDEALAAPADGRVSLTPQQASDRLKELSRALAAALCEPQTSSGVFPQHLREDLARHPLSALVRTGIRNDFEEVVFRQHPFLGTIKRALEVTVEPDSPSTVARAPLYAALSGSGSALFGLYYDGESAAAAEARLRALGVRSLRTRLLGRATYWEQMLEPVSADPVSR